MSIKFNEISELKLLIHNEKFPCSNIKGFLIGQSSAEGKVIFTVTDILPLSHNNLVGPIYDLAFKLQDTYGNDKIIGFYHSSNECASQQQLMTKGLPILVEVKSVGGGVQLHVSADCIYTISTILYWIELSILNYVDLDPIGKSRINIEKRIEETWCFAHETRTSLLGFWIVFEFTQWKGQWL